MEAGFEEMRFHDEYTGGAFTEVSVRHWTRKILLIWAAWSLFAAVVLSFGVWSDGVRTFLRGGSAFLIVCAILFRVFEKPVIHKVPKRDVGVPIIR